MSLIETKNLTHTFNKFDENGDKCGETIALDNVSLTIEKGSFVAVLGRNGSGKSTLSKHFNALLLPSGGTVYVTGMDTRDEKNLLGIRQKVGMVFQNPDNQIVTSVIEEDVAFGPENLGIEPEEIDRRITQSLDRVEMSRYRFHSPNKLSGGQKQRVAIASVLAMKPECVILDEATAMLDPKGRAEILATIRELNRKDGMTVILITHYMEETVNADRVIIMDGGVAAADMSPREMFMNPGEIMCLGLVLSETMKLGSMLKDREVPVRLPVLSEEELIAQLLDILPEKCFTIDKDSESPAKSERPAILEMKNVSYSYSRKTPYEINALKNVSLTIKKGSFTGIAGHTGSGKSTLLQLMNGLLAPDEGSVYLNGADVWKQEEPEKKKFGRRKAKKHPIKDLTKEVGLVFQYPEYQLFEDSVLKDVEYGPRNFGLPADEAKDRAVKALRQVGIDEKLYNQSPFSLSGGQKRRVAIAGVLAMRPGVMILDEPAAGLDPAGREEILALLKKLNKEKEITMVMVSHSMEDIAECADRMIVLNKGRLIYDDECRKVFSHRKELEEMGIGVPCAQRVVCALREAGRSVGQAYTVQEAADCISLAYDRKAGGEKCSET